jgi:hypothetical protein
MANGKQKHAVDPFDVFANAYGFYWATIALDKQITEHKQPHIFMWPLLVNESISLELFLKSIHILRGRNPKKFGHHIRESYKAIDPPDKRKISREYRKMLAAYPLTPHLVKAGRRMDLNSVLKRADGIFEAMRYWHEFPEWPKDADRKSSNSGAGLLLNALIGFMKGLNPTWQSRWESLLEKGHPRLGGKYVPLPT